MFFCGGKCRVWGFVVGSVRMVGSLVVGSLVVGSLVVGSLVVGSLVVGCYIQLKDPNVGNPYTVCAQSVSAYTCMTILCAVCVHQ